MVPAGEPTEETIDTLLDLLSAGDMIVDGGNSKWTDSVAHHAKCAEHEIGFVDVGTSGGVWGLEIGYCMMVGGEDESGAGGWRRSSTCSPPRGRLGSHGRTGIRPLREDGPQRDRVRADAVLRRGVRGSAQAPSYGLDNEQIAKLWSKGSVIRSWLLELAARAFETDGNDLEELEGWVEDSGEGRWTLDAGIDDRYADADAGGGAVRALQLPRGRQLRGAHGRRRCATSSAATPSRRRPRHEHRLAAQPHRHREPARRGARAAAGASDLAGHLRRDRRPRPPQAAAGALQPRPRGPAARALRDDRRRPARPGARGLPRRGDRTRSSATRGASPTRTCSRG